MMFKVVFKNLIGYAGYDATEAFSGTNLKQLHLSVRFPMIQFAYLFSINFGRKIAPHVIKKTAAIGEKN